MAKLLEGNVPMFSGAFGNIIAYQLYGKQCFRSKPIQVKDPKTEKQIANRQRFKAINVFAKKSLDTVTKQIWECCSDRMTGRNLFVKRNIAFFNQDGYISDYKNLKLSMGKISLPSQFKITTKIDGNCVVTIHWTNDPVEIHANPDDRLKIIAIVNREVIHVHGLTATRSNEKATFQLPCGHGSLIHLYAYFFDEETMHGSPSYYRRIEAPN
jgi:hypothetical protein